jgi:hypothetical protein
MMIVELSVNEMHLNHVRRNKFCPEFILVSILAELSTCFFVLLRIRKARWRSGWCPP